MDTVSVQYFGGPIGGRHVCRATAQRFTADAAHELRTPLAAIKTNLQVIQRVASDAERAEFIDGLRTSVDRASRLVEQLMSLARLDPQYER